MELVRSDYMTICCEFTNYLVGIPLRDITSTTIALAILEKIVFMFGPPEQIITDQGTSLVSKLMMYLYNTLGISVKVVSPGNHGSNRVERYIKTGSQLILAQMIQKGNVWPKFVQSCCYAHNSFVTSTLGCSPYEMVFLHKPPDNTSFGFNPLDFGTVDARRYVEQLKEKFRILREGVIKLKLRHQQEQIQRQNRMGFQKHVYTKGQLVYFYAPRLTELQTNSRKFHAIWIGPLKVSQILDKTHILVTDLNGKELKALGAVHINLLKPYFVQFGEIKEGRLVTHDNINDIARFPLNVVKPSL